MLISFSFSPRFLLSLLFSLHMAVLLAQPASFTRFYGEGSNADNATAISQTSDGGFLLGGYTGSVHPASEQAMLLRTDSAGTQIWVKYYGDERNERVTAVASASDGGYFLCGYKQNLFDNQDFVGFVIKTDANGAQLWERGFASLGWLRAEDLVPMPDGGCVVTVTGVWACEDCQQGNVTRFSSTGTVLWERDYESFPSDAVSSIVRMQTGHLVVGGQYDGAPLLSQIASTTGTTLWDVLPTDTSGTSWASVRHLAVSAADDRIAAVGVTFNGAIYLNVFNDAGSQLLAKPVPGNGSTAQTLRTQFLANGNLVVVVDRSIYQYDLSGASAGNFTFGSSMLFAAVVNDVVATTSGGVAYATLSRQNFSGEDAALVRLHASLAMQDSDVYGTFGPNHNELGWMARQTSDGGYILTGVKSYTTTSDDTYAIKTDAAGQVEWQNHYGGALFDYPRSVQVTPDGGYIFASHTTISTGTRLWSVLKTNAAGVPQWEKSHDLGNTINFTSTSVIPAAGGGYYGYSNGSLTGASNTRRPLLIRLSASGDTLWTRKIGTSNSYFRSMIQTKQGNLAISGWSLDPANPGVWMMLLSAQGDVIFNRVKAGGIGYGVTELADASLVYTGYVDLQNTNPDSLYFARYAPSGALLAERYFHDSRGYLWPRVHTAADGNLIITAGVGLNVNDSLMILKTTPDGDPIWLQKYQPTRDMFISDGSLNTDGSIVMFGYGRRTISQDYLLFKTTPDGLVGASLLVQGQAELLVSPNPSSGPIQITLRSDQLGETTFRLFDALGRQVFESSISKTEDLLVQTFDLPALPAGPYFWQACVGTRCAGATWQKQ